MGTAFIQSLARFRIKGLLGGTLLCAIVLASASQLSTCRSTTPHPHPQTPRLRYEITDRLPHDSHAFTQGLIFHDGYFYESTGLLGASSLRRSDARSGTIDRLHTLDNTLFGEGLTRVGERLIQLTWKSQTAYVYDIHDFHLLQTFHYPGKGWGLTFDGVQLIMSDGTDRLRFLDPQSFTEVRKLRITDHGRRISQLNELEFINGNIYANIYKTDLIAVINSRSGVIEAWLSLQSLYPQSLRMAAGDVLNGIAYAPAAKHLFVTGKRWPVIYEIRLLPQNPASQAAAP